MPVGWLCLLILRSRCMRAVTMSRNAVVRGLSGELNNVTDLVVAQAVGRLKNAAVCDLMLRCGAHMRISSIVPELSPVRQVGWCCCIVGTCW